MKAPELTDWAKSCCALRSLNVGEKGEAGEHEERKLSGDASRKPRSSNQAEDHQQYEWYLS